jgi:signal transduction histidine kinase
MKAWLAALVPRGIGGQVVLLLLATLIVSQAITLALVSIADSQREPLDDNLRAQARAIAAVIRMVAGTEAPAERQVILDAANRSNPDIDIQLIDQAVAAIPPGEARPGPGFIQRDLGAGFDVAIDPSQGDPDTPRPIYITLPDGSVLQAQLPFGPPPSPPLNPRLNIVLFAAIGGIALLFWATRVLSMRLRNFARVVAEFSPEGDLAPLPETGPTEIATVAAALNRMRDRIATLVRNRTLMLTAVSHDLRTPVTRLRLRSEFVEDADTRTAMLRDLDQMTAMIDSVLGLLREQRAPAAPERTDLAVLLMTIADDFADTGRDVAYAGPDRCPAVLRADDMRRAIDNLVENALRFGSKARIRLVAGKTGDLRIDVDDDGPGIPPTERQSMLQPFVRGDAARGSDHDGFGLGLAIASGVIAAHNGTLNLGDSDLGGLRATITLPR